MRRAFLPRLGNWTAARRSIAQRYLEGIGNAAVAPIGSPDEAGSCWHLFAVRVPVGRKPDFMAHLRGQGVQCSEHYPIALSDQPAMVQVRHECLSDLPNGRDLCARQVSLPCHPYLTEDEVARVVDACNGWR